MSRTVDSGRRSRQAAPRLDASAVGASMRVRRRRRALTRAGIAETIGIARATPLRAAAGRKSGTPKTLRLH